MNIGFHCTDYPPCHQGGIGSFTKDLAEGLVREGHDVTVFGFYYSFILDIDEAVIETINGVKIYRFPYSKFLDARFNIFLSRIKIYNFIKKLHKEKPFDVIETPEGSGWFPFGLPFKIPMITRLHGGTTYFAAELNRKSSRLETIMEKAQLKICNNIVSVSDYTAKKTFEIFGIKKAYSIIYNSVQLPLGFQCPKQPSENYLIVFTGSIVPRKGVEYLVIAMNTVFKEFPGATLVLAGKDNLKVKGEYFKHYLLEQVDEIYRGNIHFLGSVDRDKELFPLLCKAHVCCFPSLSEAFAIAPLEAMALRKPVVYSEFTSGKETLVHMDSGLLCNPKDPTDIAEKILLLFNDDVLCQKVADNGKSRVDNLFNYNKWLNSNINLFKKIAKNGS